MTDTPNTLINERIRLSIIDGFVDIPNGPDTKRLLWADALDAIAGSKMHIELGQRWLILPDFERRDQYPLDYFDTLGSAAEESEHVNTDGIGI